MSGLSYCWEPWWVMAALCCCLKINILQLSQCSFQVMLVVKNPSANAGHASHVQAVAVEAVAGEALGDAHAAAMGTAIQDPALLCLQSLVAPSLGTCGECGDSEFKWGPALIPWVPF